MDLRYKTPRHRKDCAVHSGELCSCSAKFNGKPFRHWQQMARKDVADTLLRALVKAEAGAPYRLPSLLVMSELQRLLEQYPDEAKEVAAEQERCAAGFSAIMQEICSGEWNPLFDPEAVGLPKENS